MRLNRIIRAFASGEVSICACLAVASIYYLFLREYLPSTALGRTYGDPWDWMVVVSTLICCLAVLFGRGEHIMLRALGLIGICTEVLLIDLTYIHLRGISVGAYAIFSNIGIVLYFGARAWLIATRDRP